MAAEEYPTVTAQRRIDGEATALMRGWLNERWLARPQDPDVFVDWDAELVEADEPTAEHLYIQQKGHREIAIKDGVVRQRLSKKHLRYYAKKAQPVFLVVVDVARREGYFLFVQEWLDQHTTTAQRKGRGELTVLVPAVQRFSDGAAVVAEFKRAREFLAKHHPGRVEDAIAHEVKNLNLPDGWAAKLDVIDGRKKFHLHPTKPGTLTLTMGSEDAKKLLDAEAFGTPVVLDGKELAIEGLPPLPNVPPQVGALLAVNPSERRRAEFHFWNDETEFRLTLTGEATRGKRGARFACALPDAPLEVEVRVERTRDMHGGAYSNANIRWHYSRWAGKPLDSLPYIEPLEEFCQLILDGKRIEHQLLIDGKRVSRGHIGQATRLEPFQNSAWALRQIRTYARVAGKLGHGPLLPDIDKFTDADLHRVDAYAALAEGKPYEISGENVVLEVTLTPPENTPDVLAKLAPDTPTPVTLSAPPDNATLFGIPVQFPPLEYHLEQASVLAMEPSRGEFLAGRSKDLVLQYTKLPGAKLLLRPCLDEPPNSSAK